MNETNDRDSPPLSEKSGHSGSSGIHVIALSSIEKKPSFSKRKDLRKMDSMGSQLSNTSEALDFLADMCVEIDEIESALAPSPSPDMAAPARRIYGQHSGSNLFRAPSPRGGPITYFKKKSSDSSLGDTSFGEIPTPYQHLSHQFTVQMKVIDLGNKQVHLVPVNEADADLLLSLTTEGSPTAYLNIAMERGDAAAYVSKTSGRAGAGAKLINPKHIYKTACDTYRVQMSKGSKTNPNGKFSRNTRSELDALWMCEFALILIDRPTGFDDILQNGNYKCLLQRGIVSSPEDFADKLHMHMQDLSSRGLLKPTEVEKLNPLMEKHIPQQYPFNDRNQQRAYEDAVQKPEVTGVIKTVPVAAGDLGFTYSTSPPTKNKGIIQKAKGSIAGLGSMITTQWGSFSDMERKKRRRVPQGQGQSGALFDGDNWLMSGQPDPTLSELTSKFVKNRHDSRGGALDETTDSNELDDDDVFPYEDVLPNGSMS
jgi:hypothetical protein